MKDRIKAIRKALNLNQDEFGEKLEISRNGVASYEIGRRAPSNAVIKLICTEYNVNPAYLLEGIEPMFNPVVEDADQFQYFKDRYGATDFEAKLFINYLETFDEETREKFADMIIRTAEEVKKRNGG